MSHHDPRPLIVRLRDDNRISRKAIQRFSSPPPACAEALKFKAPDAISKFYLTTAFRLSRRHHMRLVQVLLL